MSKKSIHALLIAINDYTDGIRPLSGCLNDMHAFRDYLAKQCKADEFEFTPSVLENEQATRQAIIESFQHFQLAKAGDVCVLYFSGHGSRIPTADFWEAYDGKNKAIVCYDTCLADKELSCLIYEATKDKPDVHFLAVMDCCHSGSNTRSDVKERMSNPNRYPLSITEYYGFDKSLYISDGNGKYSAPKGSHISFGACRSHQTAKETIIGVDFRGAFTSSLIEALDTSHSTLSYVDLEKRIGQKIENRVADQNPLLDPVNEANQHSIFLGGAILPKNIYFIAWNKYAQAWELNAGLYHGINLNNNTPSVVKLKESDVFFDINLIDTATSLGTWLSDSFTPDKKEQYEVSVQVGGTPSRLITFSPNCTAERKDNLQSSFPKAKTMYVNLTDNLYEGNFVINSSNESIWLSKKGEDIPIFFPVQANEIGLAESLDFWKKVDNVMLWYHLKNLENPVTRIKDNDIQISLYRSEGIYAWWEVNVNNMELIDDWRTATSFSYKPDIKNQIVPPSFALKIENKSNQTLFLSALLMDARFGIDNQYLPTGRLEPNQSLWLNFTQGNITTKSMGICIDDELFENGYTEQTDYLKIIASTKIFDTNAFFQEPLQVSGTASNVKRSIMRMPEIKQDDWICFLLPLHIVREKTGHFDSHDAI